MSTDECNVTEQTLAAFVAEELSEPEALSVAMHLGECRPCCNQAADYTAMKDSMGECESAPVTRWDEFDTKAGTVRVAVRKGKVVHVSWAGEATTDQPPTDVGPDSSADDEVGCCDWLDANNPVLKDPDALTAVREQIRGYMAGERDRFHMEFDLEGCRSPFQRAVLEAAGKIPYGQVVSYGELAKRIGRPKASRAVGNALGANPVPIVIPCHRVVKGDGSAGGYVGGTERKIRLLELEGSPVRAA